MEVVCHFFFLLGKWIQRRKELSEDLLMQRHPTPNPSPNPPTLLSSSPSTYTPSMPSPLAPGSKILYQPTPAPPPPKKKENWEDQLQEQSWTRSLDSCWLKRRVSNKNKTQKSKLSPYPGIPLNLQKHQKSYWINVCSSSFSKSSAIKAFAVSTWFDAHGLLCMQHCSTCMCGCVRMTHWNESIHKAVTPPWLHLLYGRGGV